jgi:chemotaxis protein CheD
MMKCAINIGEVKTFNSSVILVCYGLGSCVGLFMQDPVKGITGGAHILLPEDEAGPQDVNHWYNVNAAIDELMAQFYRKGSQLTSLRAKITGGASILNCSISIGEQNVKAVVKRLDEKRIHIAAADVGGDQSRTAQFNSDTGELLVRTGKDFSYKVF